MSKSNFDGRSLFSNEYDIHERWYPGMHLKYYWKSWYTMFPALADSLDHSFSSMLSTTTVLEQSFSTFNSETGASTLRIFLTILSCAIISISMQQ